MSNKQPAILRLGLPYYDWESEGSHGVARAGRATVFPSPIMLASTFSVDVSYRAGRVVSMEGRGKFNDYVNKHGQNNTRVVQPRLPRSQQSVTTEQRSTVQYAVLSFCDSPAALVVCCVVVLLRVTVNLFLHPKWGRGQETYGEDPFLTGEMGSSYVLGIQNWDPSNQSLSYVEAGATCKVSYQHECSAFTPSHTFHTCPV